MTTHLEAQWPELGPILDILSAAEGGHPTEEHMEHKSTIQQKVETAIADHLNVDPSRVTAKAHLRDDLGADSLDLFGLTRYLEGVFGIDIPDQQADQLHTVGQVVDHITSQFTEAALKVAIAEERFWLPKRAKAQSHTDLEAMFERLVAWAQEARGWVQNAELRHRVDDLVPERVRTEGA